MSNISKKFNNLNSYDLEFILNSVRSLRKIGYLEWESFGGKVIVRLIYGEIKICPVLTVNESLLDDSPIFGIDPFMNESTNEAKEVYQDILDAIDNHINDNRDE